MIPRSRHRYTMACTLTPNTRFRLNNSLQPMDVRRLPISVRTVSRRHEERSGKPLSRLLRIELFVDGQHQVAQLVREREPLTLP